MEQVSARGMGTESRVNKVVFGCFCMNLGIMTDQLTVLLSTHPKLHGVTSPVKGTREICFNKKSVGLLIGKDRS